VIFQSHLISMLILAAISSFLIALIKFDERRAIVRHAIRLFLALAGSVVVFSWVMSLL